MPIRKRERATAPKMVDLDRPRFLRLLDAAETRAGRETSQDEFNAMADLSLNTADGDALVRFAAIMGTTSPKGAPERWTPDHAFNLNTASGRRDRLRQLRQARRAAQKEFLELQDAAQVALAYNLKLQDERSRTGNWDLGPQHPDTDKLYRHWRLRAELGHLDNYIAAMERANRRRAGVRRKKADKLRKRKLYRSVAARIIRNGRDRERYEATKEARNAKRRAAYAARKPTGRATQYRLEESQ